MSYQFMGFRRPDGRVGARNLVGVIPSVTCANDVAQAIVTEVQGTVGYFHHQGCCQLPPDLDRITETLTSLGQSPNLGAVLIVSLGCEGTDFEQMYKTIEASGKPVRIIGIQELGGVSNAIQKGIDLARQLVIEISGQQRQPASHQAEKEDQHQGGQQLPVPAQGLLQPLHQGIEQSGGGQGKEEGGEEGQQRPSKSYHEPYRQRRQPQPQAQAQPELPPLPPCELFVGHVHRPFFNSIPQNR